jgi:hypothetical protein
MLNFVSVVVVVVEWNRPRMKMKGKIINKENENKISFKNNRSHTKKNYFIYILVLYSQACHWDIYEKRERRANFFKRWT